MRFHFPKTKKNRRRGFSVAETIVALTVIVLVTATSLTLITSQLRIEQRTSASVAATNLAENAIECFRYAEDTGAELAPLLAACGFAAAEDGEGYTAEDQGAFARLTLSEDGEATTATVTVTDGKGKRIVHVEYAR